MQRINGCWIGMGQKILLIPFGGFLRRLYQEEGLSIRAIGRRIDVAPSTVSDYLHRYNLIDEERDPPKRPQHVPYGFNFKNGKLVQDRKEQQVLRQIRQLRTAGLTYRDIATHLNRKLIATKRGGVWDPATVRKLLQRTTRK